MIVELGVRGGESTFVFERLARRCGADLVSVDVVDCSTLSDYARWHFVQEDDVAFAGRFRGWCHERGLEPRIDVLFVDTSHEYDHTLAEIDGWFPHLSPRAVVMFHDTNMGTVFRRRDWTLGHGWDNERGVARALEAHLGIPIAEGRPFEGDVGAWHVTHNPVCNGLTVLRRNHEGP
jgi:cephalosporin hydroxylase